LNFLNFPPWNIFHSLRWHCYSARRVSLSYSQIDSDSDLMVVKFACLACEECNETPSFRVFTSYPSRSAQACTVALIIPALFSAACQQRNSNWWTANRPTGNETSGSATLVQHSSGLVNIRAAPPISETGTRYGILSHLIFDKRYKIIR
jgi:hypothetical protein